MAGSNPALPQLTELFHNGRHCQYKKGEIILRAGDTPQGAYLIDSGFIKVYSLTDRGEENIHIIYGPGEMFPLAWLFRDMVRNIFYEALDEVAIWLIPKTALVELVETNAAVAYHLLRQTVDQFYVYADRVDNLQYTSAYERTVYRLLFLAGRFGVRNGSSVIIDAPITQQHIARSINLARETASREIEKLERMGLISLENQRIKIIDIDKLEAEIGEATSPNLWGLKPVDEA